MQIKTRRNIAGILSWVAAIYGLLSYLIYYVPLIGSIVLALHPINFWLLPLAAAGVVAAIIIPFAVLAVICVWVDMGLCKLMGVPFE